MEPSTKKKSVDEIWKELNSAARAPAVPKSTTTGIPGFGIPGVQTRTRILRSKSQQQPSKISQPTSYHLDASRHLNQQQQQAKTASSQAPAAGPTQEGLPLYLATLQRTINCLSDPDRSTRRSAIDSLSNKILKGDATTPKASPAQLQALLSGPLLQPLSSLLADPVERCRVNTLQLLLEVTPQLEDPGPMLLGLLPVFVARMGRLPLEEPAEEVRLTAQQLLLSAIKQSSESTLIACCGSLCCILACGFEDAFPDAKRAAAAGLAALADKLPEGALEGHCERLVQAIAPALSHQHSKVRLAVLSSLKSLVLAGLSAGLLDAQVAPAVQHLTFDHTAAVRETYYAALAAWLGCSPAHLVRHTVNESAAAATTGEAAASPPADTASARCRTYAATLLPLLLLGVSDCQPSIATATLSYVEQAGQAWQLQPTSCSALPPNDTGDLNAMDVDSSSSAAPTNPSSVAVSADVLHISEPAVAAAHLPQPYRGLPSLESRQMVAAVLPQLLQQVLSGLKEWTVSLRSAAARLLHACLVFAAPAATPHLAQLLPGLVSAMSDDEADIVLSLASSCRLLGAFVTSSAWLPLIIDAVTDAKSGPNSKANALVVLSCLTHAAAEAQQAAEPLLLQALVRAIASDEVLGCDHAGLQKQLLLVIENLLAWMSPAGVQEASQQLYMVLLKLHGAAAAAESNSNNNSSSSSNNTDPCAARETHVSTTGNPSSSQSSRVAAAMQRLAQVAGLSGGTYQLAKTHAQQLLPTLTADVKNWGSGSHNLQTFMALLQTAGVECLTELLPQVSQVMEPILSDPDKEPALKLMLLQLLDSLLEDTASAAVFVGSSDNAELTLHALLMPPLVWRAGKAAAAVRFAAATALATFLSGPQGPPPAAVLTAAVEASTPSAQRQQQQQLPGRQRQKGVLLLPLLTQLLDEDWYSDTRHTACFIMQQLLQQVGGNIGDEARRVIYPELLKRLDDSSNKVRIAACSALVAFMRSAGRGYCRTNTGYLAAGVVLHMDDSDLQVSEAACQVLEAIAATHPEVAATEVSKVRERFTAQHYCNRVLAACAAAQ